MTRRQIVTRRAAEPPVSSDLHRKCDPSVVLATDSEKEAVGRALACSDTTVGPTQVGGREEKNSTFGVIIMTQHLPERPQASVSFLFDATGEGRISLYVACNIK